MYKHIVFDFDGTLVNSIEPVLLIYNQLADRFKIRRMSFAEYRLLKNLPLNERFKRMGVPRHHFLLMGKLAREFRKAYRLQLAAIQPWEGIRELLPKLAGRGYIVSVLTSNSALNVTEFFEGQGLMINGEIRSVGGIFGKGRAIGSYIARHHLQCSELLYIGDEIRDILACRKAGVDIAAVTWGFDQREILQSEKPRYLVEDCGQLWEILRG